MEEAYPSEEGGAEHPSKRPDITSSTSTSSFLRCNHKPSRRRYQRVRYTRILKDYQRETISRDQFSVPHFRLYRLFDSEILNSFWTGEEKDKFFTALARCGKGNLIEVSRRIGTKSLAEVTAYVGLLDEATERRKRGRRHRVYDLTRTPAAVEVDEKWLAFEEKLLLKTKDKSEKVEWNDTDTVFNIEKANELAEWYSL